MKMRMPAMLVVTGLVALLAACAPRAGGESVSPAAEGHDVVAYFTEGAAVKGSTSHTVVRNGREWRFASAEHRRMFLEEPERYIPAYDGHCAWALSQGRLSQGRAQYWAIHDGRLFFNCNAEVHARWLEDRERLIEIADREWAQRGNGG